MKKKIVSLSLFLVFIFTLGLVGCKSAENKKADSGAVSGGVLRTAMFSSPGGLFLPPFATDSYDQYVTKLVFQPLLRYNTKGEFEGCLAEKWSVSPDAKVFTFVLRDGLKWQDGQPVTADDVKYSIEYVGYPNYKGARASFISAIKGVEDLKQGKTKDLSGIKVIDKKTVEITTTNTFASGFYRFGTNFEIFPKHIWEKVDVAKASEATDLLRAPIGTGPFKLTKFVPDQYIEFTRNNDYWGGVPKLGKLILQKTNQDVVQAQLLKGEIDQAYMVNLKKADETLYKSKGFNVIPTTYNAYQYLAFNLKMDVFKDKKIRQAFAFAMDRASVVDNFLAGHGVIANNPYPPTFWASPKGLKEYKYDPKKALELFKEAGWVYNENEKKMYVNGKPAKFILKYSKGNPVTEKSAPLLQQNLKDVGIELELQIMEFGVMFDQAKKGDFELAFIGQGNENDGDISKFYLSKYIKPVGDNSGSNFIRYSNPELDKLLADSLTHVDQKERTEILNKIGLLLNEELPVVYRYHWDENIVYSGKLKGREFTPIAETYYYKIENWYLEK